MTSAKIAAMATAGLLAMTGCAVNNPQVAVYVGDSQVAQSNVDAVAMVLAETTSDPADSPGGFTTAVMTILVQSKLAQQAAAEKAIVVTDAQRLAVYASNELYAPLVKNPVTTDFMKGFADASVILAGDAGAAAFKDVVARTSIRVNPRYGKWDAATGGLVDGSTGSISEQAPIKQE